METNKAGFEIETCGRCCGTGNYSYNQVHGTRCFGCGGSGKKYTKRGLVAKNFFEASAMIKMEEVKVGDVVQVDHMVNPNAFAKIFVEVTEVQEPKVTGSATVNGVEFPVVAMTFIWSHSKYGKGGFAAAPSRPVRKGLNAEEKAEKLAEAIAYQNSLTAAGKPKKRVGA